MQSTSGQLTSSAVGAAATAVGVGAEAVVTGVGAEAVVAGVGEGETLQLSLIRGRSIFSGSKVEFMYKGIDSLPLNFFLILISLQPNFVVLKLFKL